MVQRHPRAGRQFILDHCGVPDIQGGGLDPWRQHIRELAKFPNLACKISGVVAYCDPQRVTVEAIRPYIEHCIECFGWERVVFGGDWPVCNITTSLGRWVEIAKKLSAGKPSNIRKNFLQKMPGGFTGWTNKYKTDSLSCRSGLAMNVRIMIKFFMRMPA